MHGNLKNMLFFKLVTQLEVILIYYHYLRENLNKYKKDQSCRDLYNYMPL